MRARVVFNVMQKQQFLAKSGYKEVYYIVLSKTLNCLPSPEQDRKLFTESAGPRAKGVAPLLDAELSLFPM